MKNDVLNPATWNMEQWCDALTAVAVAGFTFATMMTVIYIFH